jgi:hypothetical protein
MPRTAGTPEYDFTNPRTRTADSRSEVAGGGCAGLSGWLRVSVIVMSST